MKKTNPGIKIKIEKVGSNTIKYAVRPGGPKKILLIHGLNFNWSLWEKVLPDISSQFTCYALSLPKYGRYRLDHYSKTIRGFIKNHELEEQFFVGHSLGGIIALRLVADGVKFKRIILVNVPLFSQPPELTKRAFNYWKEKLEKDPIIKKTFLFFPNRIRRLRRIFERAPLESYLEGFSDVLSYSFKNDVKKTNGKIPLLIIDGQFDFLLWACRGKSLYRELNPEAIIKLYTHHFIPRAYPKRTAKIINDFFLGQKTEVQNGLSLFLPKVSHRLLKGINRQKRAMKLT